MYKKLLYILPLAVILAGCGDTDYTENQIDGEGSIDLRSYFPFEDFTKKFSGYSPKKGLTLY